MDTIILIYYERYVAAYRADEQLNAILITTKITTINIQIIQSTIKLLIQYSPNTICAQIFRI